MSIDHFRDTATDSQTTDITNFAVVFHYDVTIKALERLQSSAYYLWRDNIMKNNGKVRDVCSLIPFGILSRGRFIILLFTDAPPTEEGHQ